MFTKSISVKDKPKILIIDNSIEVTGALKSIVQTAQNLQSFFEFNFLIPSDTKVDKYIKVTVGSSVTHLSMLELRKKSFNILFYVPVLLINAFKLNRILKRKNITLLHVNDFYNLLPVILRIFGGNTPYVCHIRFMPDRFPRWLFSFWIKLHLRYASSIIAVSDSVMKLLPSNPKIIRIYDELPMQENYPVKPYKRVDELSYRFLYLSNFIAGKGQNFALQAFARIHKMIPNWKLRFVGSDMGLEKNRIYVQNLKNFAQKELISKKIEWIGFTNDVELEYKSADIVLNFSESESLSKTCLEALFFGRLLIATRCGGPSEIIEDRVTGVLVANRDLVAMTTAMQDMAKNILRLNSMAINARNSVREKFRIENTSYRIMQIYNSVLLEKRMTN